jgi:insulysin
MLTKYQTPSPNELTHPSLYVALVGDQLNEFGYDAEMAGLAWSLTRESDGLFLGAYGFNDKLHVLLSKLVHGMRHLVVKPERFDVVKDSLLRQLQNWKLNAPHEHAMHYTRYLLMTRAWTTEEKEAALQGLNSSLHFWADVSRNQTQGRASLHPRAIVQFALRITDPRQRF